MHIKNIHSMIEKLSECAKCELDKGIESIDTKEMGEVAEIIKELCEAEYYAKVSKAMDEHDFDNAEEIMDEGRRGYRGQPRDSRGRYMRRGYDEMMYMPEMYRDMDRDSMGRMYYTGSTSTGGSQGQSNGSSSMGSSSGGTSGGSMGYSEGGSMGSGSRQGQNMSRTESARRGYLETKEMHKNNTQEDKQAKQKELDKWMSEFTTDVKGMVGEMTPEEKTLLKTRLTQLQSSL